MGEPSCHIIRFHYYASQFRSTYRCWAISATAVDQLVDAVTVVGEVWGEVFVGLLVTVVGDELLEVVGHLRGLIECQAWRSTTVTTVATVALVVVTLEKRASEGGDGEEASGDDGGAHFCGISGI